MPRGSQLYLRLAVVLYGALNATLYAGLLPLWEGFDEPFHYSYVQRLWRERRPPVLGRATLTEEVWESLFLAPGSFIVKRNIPVIRTYDEYLSLDERQRSLLREQLERLDWRAAGRSSEAANYEAQQSPLAYAVLGIFDVIWRQVPLLHRVWRLRLVCGISAAVGTGLLTVKLAGQIGLSGLWQLAAAFLVLSSQMFYASVAHIANDWLAIPLFALILTTAISVLERPGAFNMIVFSSALAAGLLTKSYFLAAVPIGIGVLFASRRVQSARYVWPGVMAPLTLAAAWYVRNLVLYRDLSGMQQTVGSGIPLARIWHAVPHFHWFTVIDMTAASSLWTGNNSNTTFSSKTIHLMLFLLSVAVALYVRKCFKIFRRAEVVIVAALLAYSAALMYCALLLYAPPGNGPPPWYVQPMWPPTLCLCMAGLAGSRRLGNKILVLMLCLWSYVMTATYIAKLIPLYGGYHAEHVRIAELARWYRDDLVNTRQVLSQLCMIGPSMLAVLLAVSLVGAAGISMALMAGAFNPRYRKE